MPGLTAQILKIPAAAKCSSATCASVAMRQHRVTVDEPTSRHGTDAGAMPLELLAASFIGCTNVIANRIATEMGIVLSELEIDVVLELDARALAGESVPAVFPGVRLNVSGRSNGGPDDLQTLKTRLAAQCPVSVLFRQAGANVVENWAIQPF